MSADEQDYREVIREREAAEEADLKVINRRFGWWLLAGLVVLSAFVVVVSSDDDDDHPPVALVTSKEMGDDWPLIVRSGHLRCDANAITFEMADGRVFAVNGTAKTWTDYPAIDQIWADADFGLKKNIGPLIDRGLELC